MASVFALTFALLQSAQAQTYRVLHSFTGGSDGQSPIAGLTIDRAGNLYGTTLYGGSFENGVVFKLANRGGSFILSPLHNFGDSGDGSNPYAKVTIGPDTGLYGTTNLGGGSDSGTVFKVRVPPTVCDTAICYWNESLLYQFTGGGDGGHPDSALIFDQNGNMFGSSGGTICCGVVYQFTPSGGAGHRAFCTHSPAEVMGALPRVVSSAIKPATSMV